MYHITIGHFNRQWSHHISETRPVADLGFLYRVCHDIKFDVKFYLIYIYQLKNSI
jgi:hypothetical protein